MIHWIDISERYLERISVFHERLDQETSDGCPNFDLKESHICFKSPENTDSLFGVVVNMFNSGVIWTYLNLSLGDHRLMTWDLIYLSFSLLICKRRALIGSMSWSNSED